MSAIVILHLKCDVAGCCRRCAPDADTLDEARTVAAAAFGWAFVEGYDYCGDCARLPDVVAALAARRGTR